MKDRKKKTKRGEKKVVGGAPRSRMNAVRLPKDLEFILPNYASIASKALGLDHSRIEPKIELPLP